MPESIAGTAALRELFDRKIAPRAAELVEERQRLEKGALWARIILVPIIIASGYFALWALDEVDNALIIFILLAPFVLLAVFFTMRVIFLMGFVERFKRSIVPEILSHYGDFSYNPFPADTAYKPLVTNGLLLRVDRAVCEDQIVGTYRGVQVRALECTASRKEKNESTQVFQGTLVKMPLKREVAGRYRLTTKKWHHAETGEADEGAWQDINLESTQFERLFDFEGTDQIEGRTILTPLQIERWLAFEKIYDGQPVRAVMAGRNAYIALSHTNDWLDDPVMKKNAAALFEQVTQLVRDLESVLMIVDVLHFGDDAR